MRDIGTRHFPVHDSEEDTTAAILNDPEEHIRRTYVVQLHVEELRVYAWHHTRRVSITPDVSWKFHLWIMNPVNSASQ